MDLFPRSVVVTGASGWLGLNLLKALQWGLEDIIPAPSEAPKIRALVLPGERSALLKDHPAVEWVEGDLLEGDAVRELLRGMEGGVLVHAAGLIHPRKVSDLYEVNVRATKQLLQAAVQHGIKRAIVISSNSPCGCNPDASHQFTESAPYNPYMGYGRSKMEMELLTQKFQAAGRIETVILRPVWFYGPHQPARQTLFFQMVRDGRAPIVGSGENRRSMAYVGNICDVIVRALQAPQAVGKIYWVADERPYTMNEIVDTIERLLETEFRQKCAHRRMRLPGFASEIALAVDASLQAWGLYHQKIHVLSEMNKTIACSVERVRQELGYPAKVSLEEGMRRSMAWLRDKKIPL